MAIQPNKIIISRTDSIGDVILTLPVASVVKQYFPDCYVCFLGTKYTKPVIELCESVDEFLNWDEIQNKKESEQVDFFRKLSADTIIHIFPRKKLAQIAKKSSIPNRIGTSHRIYHLTTCNQLLNLGRKNSDLHEAQLNLKLLKPLGIVQDFPLMTIPDLYTLKPPDPLPPEFKRLLEGSKFNLILHPKSKGSAREWGAENFSKLIQLLPQDIKIFISGTKEEGEKLRKELIDKNNNVTDITGVMSLSELISFINEADGLIAASTGPLHIAAALGKNSLGLYAPMSPIDPGRWAPLGKSSQFMVKDKICNDCRRTENCHCIRELAVESVMEVVRNWYISKLQV